MCGLRAGEVKGEARYCVTGLQVTRRLPAFVRERRDEDEGGLSQRVGV